VSTRWSIGPVDGVFSKDTVTVGNIDVAFQLFAEVRNVSKIIDELVATLKAEQIADDDKNDYCEVEFDKAEDKKKSLLQGESDLEAPSVGTMEIVFNTSS